MANKTLQECYITAKTAFKNAKLPTADLDADLLVGWITATSRLDRINNPNIVIADELCSELDSIIKRRINSEPVHRIIGTRNFYGRDFKLNLDTLEPRPDTETLIDAVLPHIHTISQRKDTVNIVDMGTGSGAIAITLACEETKVKVVGVELSQNALDMAQNNAIYHGVKERFTPCLSNWFNKLNGKFDIIVSNPPYIPHQDIEKLDTGVRGYDPIRALDGGHDGLDFYRRLATQSRPFLYNDGYIIVEIGIDQAQDINQLFHNNGFRQIESVADLSGIIRVLVFKNQNN